MKAKVILIALACVFVVVAFAIYFSAQSLYSDECESTYVSDAVARGIEAELRPFAGPVSVSLRDSEAVGWDCTFDEISITSRISKKTLRLKKVVASMNVFKAVFFDSYTVEVEGLFDGKNKGAATAIVSPSLLSIADGKTAEIRWVKAEAKGVSYQWLTDLFFAGSPSSARLAMVGGAIDVDVLYKNNVADARIQLRKPRWSVRGRMQGTIQSDSLAIEMRYAKNELRLTKPSVLKAKPGSLSVSGRIALGRGAPRFDLKARVSGQQVMSVLAAKLFRCGKPVRKSFAVTGPLRRPSCR